jgi:tetratricopeptide (TPR) repeat protein
VQQGAEAENRGQLDRAKHLYEEASRIDSRNSEALAGLGTVSLKRGDPATARQYFGRALSINPNYVPALVGQADALWQEGDKNGAMTKYKDLVDRFPESAGYPSYVKTRAAGSSSGAASTSGGSSDTSSPKPAAPGKPAELTLPGNVPSDLPGAPP